LKISVIVAVHNAVHTITDALESLRDQQYKDIECIVVDGASTDGTLQKIQRFGGVVHCLLSEPDQGMYHALNKGIRLATGDVIGFLHADDYFADSLALNRVADALAAPGTDACYGDLCYVGKGDSRFRYWHAGQYRRERLAWGWMPPHPTFYARLSVYRQYGEFDTRYRIAADYDYILRIMLGGRITCAYIPHVLVHMRSGGISNRSLGNILRKSYEDYCILREHRLGGLLVLFNKNISKIRQVIFRNY